MACANWLLFDSTETSHSRVPTNNRKMTRKSSRNSKGSCAPKAQRYSLSQELKTIDVSPSLTVDTTGAVSLLNGCQRGTDYVERIGRELRLRSVDVLLTAQVTSATGVDQIHRYLLVFDKQPNGVALTLADVLSTPSVDAQLNLNNESRFRILADERYHLNASGEPGSQKAVHIAQRLALRVRFNSGTAGTVADIATGSLYLITIGSIAAGATAGTLSGRSRVRFTDA